MRIMIIIAASIFMACSEDSVRFSESEYINTETDQQLSIDSNSDISMEDTITDEEGSDTSKSDSGDEQINQTTGDFHIISQNSAKESEYVSGSFLDSEGRLLVWGYLDRESSDAAIWRFNADGTLDTSFGTNGRFLWDSLEGLDDQVYTIKETSDGSLLVGGRSRNANNSWEGLIGKLSKDGQADISFSPSGFKIIDIDDTKSRFLRSATFDSQDRLLLSGVATGSSFDVSIIRADAMGQVDPSFADSGYFQWDSSQAPLFGTSDKEYGQKLLVDGGFIYVAGSSDFSSSGFVMKLSESDGSIMKVKAGLQFKAMDIKLQGSHLYLSGYRLSPTADACWAKLSSLELELDSTYGANGESCYTGSSGAEQGRAYNISVSSSGDAFVGGINYDRGKDGIIVKSLTNGSVDTNWGSSGWMLFSDPSLADSYDTVSSTIIANDRVYILGRTQIKINEINYSRLYIKYTSGL